MLVKRPNVFLIYFILTQYTSLYLSLTFYFFLICINSMDRQINQFFKFPIYLRDRPGWTLRKISDINIDSVSFRMRMVTQNNTAPIRYIRYPVPAPSPIRTLVPTPFMFGVFPLVDNFHISVSTISVSRAGPLSGSVNNSPPPLHAPLKEPAVVGQYLCMWPVSLHPKHWLPVGGPAPDLGVLTPLPLWPPRGFEPALSERVTPLGVLYPAPRKNILCVSKL